MQKKRKQYLKFFIGFAFAMSFIIFAGQALALEVGISQVAEEIGLGGGDIRVIIARIIRSFLGLLGIIAVVLILYGGFTWMTAGGNDEKIAKAKKILVNAVIGLAIILASFAITQFVLNALLTATGVGPEGPPGGPGGPGGIPGTGVRVFQVQSMNPQGSVPIRNVTVRILFNTTVDERTVENNVSITRVSDGAEIDGAYTTLGSKVSFVPSAACPAPNADRKCFDSDTEYQITVHEGLRSSGGMFISCSGFGAQCQGRFTTGNLVDVSGPTVELTYPDSGQAVPVNSIITLQAVAEDDAGVSLIDFEIDGALFGSDGPAPPTPRTFTGEVDWDTTGYTTGSRHEIRARAFDIDDNDTLSGAVNVTVRAEHCFNGVQDEGETGIDCGGVSATDPDWCGSCSGDSCTTNEDCSSGYCEGGVCVSLPLIESIDPLDGAAGTFVTISGQYFGTTTGRVRFMGASGEGDESAASLAPCEGAWSNNQIVIVVPEGAISGPIEVATSGGEADLTNDTRGPVVPDFLVNSVERPGVCRVSPQEGESGDEVVVSGSGFGDAADRVLFGDIDAGRIVNWQSDRITAVVPPLSLGTHLVRVRVAGNSSNGVDFRVVESGLAGKPVIAEIIPADGPVGEYVTVRGSNFGSSIGRITLTNTSTGQSALGDFSFPESCGDDFWFRDNITFKVPRNYSDGSSVTVGGHEVRVTRSDGKTSDPVDFAVNEDALSPGICRLAPNVGPAGTGVTIYGERLGSSPGTATFYNSKNADVTSWESDQILTEVPSLAATGPVTITSAGGLMSNGLNFRVENCLDEPSACDVDQQCCPDGSCVGAEEECAIPPSQASFVWRFGTGIIPITPQVIESCLADDLPASPSPWSERRGGEQVCINAAPTVRFNVPMDTIRFNTSNIQMKKCVGLGDDPCSATVDVSVARILPINENRGFQIKTTANLDADSWYEVKLTTNLRGDESVGSLEMEENARECGEGYAYCFRWKTQASTDLCTLGDVAVQPQYKIARDLDPVPYNAAAIAGEDICISLDASSYDWIWSSSDISKAQVTVPSPSDPQLAQAEPILETRGEPVEISAATEGLNDAGFLEIDFTDPAVVEYEPDCGEACLNATVRVRFNTLMDRESILTPGNIQLLECDNENCRYFSGPNLVTDIRAVDPSTWQEILIMHPNFRARQYYRVILSDQIKSYTLTNLTGLNYGDNFSWTFRTQDDVCAIDRIEIAPAVGRVYAQGERQLFTAVPYGEADECSSEGQSLDPTVYDWGWSVIETAVGRLLGGGAIDTSPDSASDFCDKTRCLHLGTVANIAVCGNGIVETTMGEECDDSNTASGDGCSGRCLTEPVASVEAGGTCGNADIESLSYVSPWRNSWIEGAEECDDGNDLDGDGCSAGCQNEGSTLGGSICGNGSIGDAEDCDDGNRRSGDGCSAECLNEGSNPGPLGVCGNGLAETELGEDCDDGRACADYSACRSNMDCIGIGDEQCRPRSGDGCSEKCLHEGTYPCAAPSDPSCCGNGLVDTGEECDGGEGCGLNCLKLGSSYLYSTPSFCGDGIVGIGEETGCEIGRGDGRSDAVQIVEAVGAGTVDEDGFQRTPVRAVADEVTGEATFEIECGFTLDAECKAIDSRLGLAGNSCCYPMPSVTSVIPPSDANDLCRNTKIQLTFNEAIDSASVQYQEGDEMRSRVLLIRGTSDACGEGQTDYAIALAGEKKVNWWQRIWQGIKQFFAQIFFKSVLASAEGSPRALHYCSGNVVDGNVMVSGQIVTYRLKRALESNTWYQIRVLAGFKSSRGVTMDRDYVSFFGTGTEICSLDFVEIIDPAGTFFFSKAEARTFVANAMTRRSSTPQPIEEIPGVYEWEWSWATSKEDTAESNIISAEGVDRADSAITPQGKNGQEQLTAQAKVTQNTIFGKACSRDSDCPRNLCVIPSGETVGRCAGEVVSQTRPVVAMLCENPWTDFTDSDLWHYSTMYCRDNKPNILPELTVTEVSSPPPGVLKEFLLVYEDAPAEAAWARDAIGFRIMPNPDHLSPEEWYREQGFGGEPQSIEVDGYPALQYGRSVYINAANKVGDPIYTNIYILSHNEGAGEITMNIYKQLLTNFILNYDNVSNGNVCRDRLGELMEAEGGGVIHCSHDLECLAHQAGAFCDADKDKLQRDVKRIAELIGLQKSIDTYRLITGGKSSCVIDGTDLDFSCTSDEDCLPLESRARCRVVGGQVPSLGSGSYLRAYSTSLWPSWQTELGSALGENPPDDPVNRLGVCENGYDATTCFDSNEIKFICPTGSLIYQYHSVGGTNYQIYADLEFGNDTLWAPDNSLPYRVVWNERCDGDIMSNTDLCGDGLKGPGEVCELGESKWVAEGCTGTERREVGCVQDGTVCRWAESGETGYGACVLQTLTCGNGVREGFCTGGDNDGFLCRSDLDCPGGICTMLEACDDGADNGRYGHCNAECSASGAYCGDKRLAGAEQCDLGDAAHRVCPSMGYCEPINGEYDSGCSWDCRVPGPICGDGIVQPEEQCEGDEFEERNDGYCKYYPGVTCETNEDCPGRPAGRYCMMGDIVTGSCRPDYPFCPSGGTCRSLEATNICLEPCTTDPETGYQLKRVRSCDTTTCQWDDWSTACVTEDVCGNGIIEGREECDDGNTDNSDGCVIVSGRESDLSVSCKISYCGDGFRYAGVETCDSGSANGIPCTPRYSESCTYCTDRCNWATVSGAYCGDGVIQSGEECDEGPIACWYGDCPEPCLLTPGTYRRYGGSEPRACDPYGPASQCNICPEGEGLVICTSGVCQGQTVSLNHVPAVPPSAPLDYNYSAQYCDSTCHVARRDRPRCGDGIVQTRPYPPTPWEHPELWRSPLYYSCDPTRKSCPGDYECREGINLTETSGPDYYCFLPGGGGSVIERVGEVCDSGENNGRYSLTTPNCNLTCSAFAPYCGDGYKDTGEQCDWGGNEFNGKVDMVFISTDPVVNYGSYTCTTEPSLLSVCQTMGAKMAEYSAFYDINSTFYLANDSVASILPTEAAILMGCIDNMAVEGDLHDTSGGLVGSYPGLSGHGLCTQPWAGDLLGCPAADSTHTRRDGRHFTDADGKPFWAGAVVDIAASHSWREGSLKLIVVVDNNTARPGYRGNGPGAWNALVGVYEDTKAMNAINTYFNTFAIGERPRLAFLVDQTQTSAHCLRASGNWSSFISSLMSFKSSWGDGAKYIEYTPSTASNALDNLFNSIFCDSNWDTANDCSCLNPPCL